MPINKIIVEETIKFTAADKRRQIESALTGVSGSLNEIQDNIDFILKELPNVELPDEILKEVKGLLDDFRAAMPKSIKIEIAKGWWALTQADDYTVLLRDWQDKEILDNIEHTNIYMQDYFSKLDSIIIKLQQPENEKYSLARALIMESVTNILNANQKNFERYKGLRINLNNAVKSKKPKDPIMEMVEKIFLNSFGCPKCRKLPDASTNFDELPYKRVKTLYDTSHESFWLSECKFCKQPYLEEFKDEIGWFGGDPMWHYWMPLTGLGFESLKVEDGDPDYMGVDKDLDYIKSQMHKRLFLTKEYIKEPRFFWSDRRPN